jgi:hypothetical protein
MDETAKFARSILNRPFSVRHIENIHYSIMMIHRSDPLPCLE